MLRRLLGPLLLAVALPACGGENGTESAAPSSSTTAVTAAPTTAVTSASTTASSAPCALTDATLDAKTSPAPGTRAVLSNVAVGAHPQCGYDRVTFTFMRGTPGYDVRYVKRPIVQDGSGEQVQVKGAHVLEVRFDDASSADDQGRPMYSGPKTVRAGGTAALVEAVRVGDFEGVLTWAVGVDTTKQPFVVHRLTNPTRVVVDIVRS